MEQAVEVEIVTETISARYGTLAVGAILRTDGSYAAHLVDDCQAAKYVMRKLLATEPAANADAVVQTSAQAGEDPYAHLGTLVAMVTDVSDQPVQTSAQAGEQPIVEGAASPMAVEPQPFDDNQ